MSGVHFRLAIVLLIHMTCNNTSMKLVMQQSRMRRRAINERRLDPFGGKA